MQLTFAYNGVGGPVSFEVNASRAGPLMRSHTGQFKPVVFVGFSFHIGPLPSIFIGGTKDCFMPSVLSEVVDPTRWSTGFHDHEVNFVHFEVL